MNLNEGKRPRPRRCMMYGVHGVGKSSWAAGSPHHVFLNFEDGLHDIDCRSTNRIMEWFEVDTLLQDLLSEPKDLQWIVIDTLDWAETLIHRQVAETAGGKESIADIPYGAGYKAALAKWTSLLRKLDLIIDARKCGVIALAHADITRFDSPETEAYDRYQPALHKLANNLWMEWCDEVLFASYKVFTRKEDQGFGRERNIAVGGERIIRTQESPAFLAKSRLNLPLEMKFDWKTYEDAIRANSTPAKKAAK